MNRHYKLNCKRLENAGYQAAFRFDDVLAIYRHKMTGEYYYCDGVAIRQGKPPRELLLKNGVHEMICESASC
jgi:hypothetical protein